MQILAWHPSHHFKYQQLQKKIWMTPHINDAVTPAVEMLLLALGRGFLNMDSLDIHGILDAAKLYLSLSSQFLGIKSLHINSLQVQQHQNAIQRFVQVFPNLVNLSLSF